MSPRPDIPGVIAPPPLIYMAFLAAGWAVERFGMDFTLNLPDPVRRWGALGLIIAGFMLEGEAAERFRRLGTPLQPWRPTTALATTGAYRLSRNPVYLGFAIIYAGLAIGLDSPVALTLLIPCLVVMDRFVVAREERYLEAKFGPDWRAYAARVRRWL